jgi:hypothetical protein
LHAIIKLIKNLHACIITTICWKIILKPTHKWQFCYHCTLHGSKRMGWAEFDANFGAHSMDRPSFVIVHTTHHLQQQYLHSLQTICKNLQNWTPQNVHRFQKSTLVFIPSFGEVTYSLVFGQKNLPRSLCSLCRTPINFAKQFCEYSFSFICYSNPCRNDGDNDGACVKH